MKNLFTKTLLAIMLVFPFITIAQTTHNVMAGNYYFSNVISRSSKTMAECRSEKIKIERTGTEG